MTLPLCYLWEVYFTPHMLVWHWRGDRRSAVDLLKDADSHNAAQFLKAAVVAGLNIIISGGTGSGKTTLLNVLSSFIPEDERILTIEDAAELQLQQPHVVRLESRPANIEGKGRIGIRELVVNSLRMRPDRIVVGECRGGDLRQRINEPSSRRASICPPRSLASRTRITGMTMDASGQPIPFLGQFYALFAAGEDHSAVITIDFVPRVICGHGINQVRLLFGVGKDIAHAIFGSHLRPTITPALHVNVLAPLFGGE
jgi:energy-coupling factor transporter ATP-binding protein EcfA2